MVLVARLVEAIQRHRADVQAASEEPTTVDRALWARLELLRLPDGTPITALTKRTFPPPAADAPNPTPNR